MSKLNNSAWSFTEIPAEERLDINAILGGSTSTSDQGNPFDAPTAAASEINACIFCGDSFIPTDPDMVIEGLEHQFPKEWLEQVSVRRTVPVRVEKSTVSESFIRRCCDEIPFGPAGENRDAGCRRDRRLCCAVPFPPVEDCRSKK